MKNLNKTVVKFTYKKRKYEVDMLMDSNYSYGAGDTEYAFDIFDVTNNKKVECIGQFYAYEGANYKQLAIAEIKEME